MAYHHKGETHVQDGIPIKILPSWDDLLVEVRKKRDAMFALTDKVLTPDYTENWEPLSEERKNAYLTYRQALRDIIERDDLTNLI
jgi:Phage tail assembly chaperone protein